MNPRKIPWRQVLSHWEIYLLVLPTLLLVGLFQYYPAASGIYHSFFRWNGADVSEWVGLKNYTDLLHSPEFWSSFNVAFTLGIWNVIKMVPAIAVAIWIHRCRSDRAQFFYRLMFIAPMVVPGLVMALLWRTFFFEANSGYLNQFLNLSGLMDFLVRLDQWFHWGGIFRDGYQPAWLGDPRLILIACIVWGLPWVGSFAVLTHLAKLQNIPKETYEAGEIDGTSWWSKFSQIELPLMMGSIYIMLVFVIIGTIKDAGMILALAGLEGGPGGAVTVPALFMLRKAFVSQEMGAACAIGIILMLVVVSLQKLSVLVLDREAVPHWMRPTLRPLGMLLGAALYFLASWRFLGGGIFLLSFPWDKAWFACVQVGNVLGLKKSERSDDAHFIPSLSPASPAKQWALRVFKHLAIWTVLLFAFLPFYLMLVVSFKTNAQFYDAPAVPSAPFHWQNWIDAWNLIQPSVANSLYISTLGTVFTLVFGLGGAYFFARQRMPFSTFFWNAILILMMMPAVANLVPLFRLLADLNLLNTLSALILVGTSSGQIFAIFVLRSFVAEIPQDLFEAAEIDGANHLQQVFTIVLPLCGPILGTIGVMHFISEWNEFVLPLVVMRDSDMLPVMVQLQRLSGEYIKFFGPLMAGYALASIPVIILFAFSMRLFVKGMTDGAVKG